jgi:hypothetical protein
MVALGCKELQLQAFILQNSCNNLVYYCCNHVFELLFIFMFVYPFNLVSISCIVFLILHPIISYV